MRGNVEDGWKLLVFSMCFLGRCVFWEFQMLPPFALPGPDWRPRRHGVLHVIKLTWRQNMPLIGWLSHLGKAGCCEAENPIRYFWVELVAGLILVVISLFLCTAFAGLSALSGFMHYFSDRHEEIHTRCYITWGNNPGLIFVLAELPGLPGLRMLSSGVF